MSNVNSQSRKSRPEEKDTVTINITDEHGAVRGTFELWGAAARDDRELQYGKASNLILDAKNSDDELMLKRGSSYALIIPKYLFFTTATAILTILVLAGMFVIEQKKPHSNVYASAPNGYTIKLNTYGSVSDALNAKVPSATPFESKQNKKSNEVNK